MTSKARGRAHAAPRSREDGSARMKVLHVNCPWCHAAFAARFDADAIVKAPRSLYSTCITPPCGHVFVMYLDKQANVRGMEKIDTHCVLVEPIDITINGSPGGARVPGNIPA